MESGEDKLRKAFEKIEENGSKDFEEMQVIRGKIVEWEEKQRMKQQMIKGRIMQQLTLQSMFEGNKNEHSALSKRNVKMIDQLQKQDKKLDRRISNNNLSLRNSPNKGTHSKSKESF